MLDHIKKHRDEIRENISQQFIQKSKKRGGGSRGGKIIGHTKSSKPIYDSAGHSSHSNFTGLDHKDASDLHDKLMKKDPDNSDSHYNHMMSHKDSAKMKESSVDVAKQVTKKKTTDKEYQDKHYMDFRNS